MMDMKETMNSHVYRWLITVLNEMTLDNPHRHTLGKKNLKHSKLEYDYFS